MATQNEYNMMCVNGNPIAMTDNTSLMISDLDGNSQLENYYHLPCPTSGFDSFQPPPVDFDGFLTLEDFEGGPMCEIPPKYMNTSTLTQINSQFNVNIKGNNGIKCNRRKINPVKHPGLKLQTPIAYKCDTDPSVIPITKDGMAICEKCGAIGVKHAFYTRHRNFCSLACARNCFPKDYDETPAEDSASSSPHTDPPPLQPPDSLPYTVSNDEFITKEPVPLQTSSHGLFHPVPPLQQQQQQQQSQFPGWFVLPTVGAHASSLPTETETTEQQQSSKGSYNWTTQLTKDSTFTAAPVNLFRHTPMSDCWENIVEGMKVEVANSKDSYWVATVTKVAGYLARLRYEGFEESDGKDFWISLCSPDIHHVGWCATRGKPLIPPSTVMDNTKVTDWKELLVRTLTGARTLQSNFYSKVVESMKSRFRVGLLLEVVDKQHLSQVCLATIRSVVGKRLHVLYYNAHSKDPGFWCHEDSPLIHPVGWATRVGHTIDAPKEYLERCEIGLVDKDDACDELFTAPFQASFGQQHAATRGFHVGDKLEAVDPLNLSAICAATVMKILNDGYLMIRIDSFDPDPKGRDWFCYHASSPCIFPANFCKENHVPFLPPIGESQEKFSWESYAEKTGCILASPDLFQWEVPDHGFAPGQHVESVDLMSPWLICVATVSRVVGRLLRIHFDGWGDEYDQWLDCRSSDLFPVGWCDLVGHKLEGPCEVKDAAPRRGRPRRKLKNSIKNVKSSKKLTTEISKDTVKDIKEIEEAIDCSQTESTVDIPTPMDVEPLICSTADTVPTTSSPYIPRLGGAIDLSGGVLDPASWSSNDVGTFLKINDCGFYSHIFVNKGINGISLLNLTQDQTMDLTDRKIGPTVKILNLIQLLKTKTAKLNMKKL